ncbi:putative cytochrome P450 monooxygenase [Aspergillus novofumigatus IBT 16806]|uniref:Cytochrome P450 n=1 Tax=Aspergillus novofumigatus (strain IBT 16806) TaxID=1392255 RepID=A0A2I1CB71_ASPN1|nr:cytochrome P450 [Aspergillus novofumigatus IBT 16806]PKX94888.1 cytochrome P450 [Aspergillus novofumigatus IBT 16806]
MAVLAVLLLILCVFGGILWNYTRLNAIPGPVLAGLSDIWSQCLKSSPRYGYGLERLHRKYGEVVRIGPKTVSVSTPSIVLWLDAACPQTTKSFLDSYVDEPERVTVNSPLKSNHRVYLDEQTDDGPQHHDKTKDLVLDFLRVIRKQRTLKLALFRTFATDIVRRTFVDDLDRAAAMGTGTNPTDRCRFTASLEHIMFKSPIAKLKRKRNNSLTWVSCTGTYSGRNDASIFEVLPETGRRTFLQVGTREDADPHASLIAKGADCMIAAFASVFLHLVKCPTAMSQLKHEVDIAFCKEALSGILQKEKELYTLPFLDAVMKESMRLAMRFDYRRDVAAGGLAVLGHYLPEGTVVQFRSETLRNNHTIFGEDVSSFRPQRWLQANLDQQQLRRMEAALLVLQPNMPDSAKARSAWLELKRAAALIIWKFDVSAVGSLAEVRLIYLSFILSIMRKCPSKMPFLRSKNTISW